MERSIKNLKIVIYTDTKFVVKMGYKNEPYFHLEIVFSFHVENNFIDRCSGLDNLDKSIRRLFNLNKSQTEVFTVLVSLGGRPVTIKELKDFCSQELPKIYEALKILVSKGLVHETPTHPKQVYAIDPDEMQRLVDNYFFRKFVEKYKENFGEGLKFRQPRYNSINSTESFYRIASEMLDANLSEYFFLTSRGTSFRVIAGFEKPRKENKMFCSKLSRIIQNSNINFYLLINLDLYEDNKRLAILSEKYPNLKIINIKIYEGVSALICKEKVLLGWRSTVEEKRTQPIDQGLYIEFPKIALFIKTLLDNIIKIHNLKNSSG